MPHATAVRDAQEEQDDLLIQRALDPENPIDFSRELDPGEKADDAVNFSDLDDDDLAEDEDDKEEQHLDVIAQSSEVDESPDDSGHSLKSKYPQEHVQGDDSHRDVLDDLFGERLSSPVDNENAADEIGHLNRSALTNKAFDASAALGYDRDRRTPAFASLPHIHTGGSDVYKPPSSTRAAQDVGGHSKEQLLQQELFAMSGEALGKLDVVPVIETQEDLLAALWPRFELDTVPKFMDLLPPKKARYIGKIPLRRPKPVQPNRLNLEIAVDQEKSFRLASGSNRRVQEETGRLGLITIEKEPSEGEREEDEEDLESDFECDPVGGVSWQDLQILCEDWDTHTSTEASSQGTPEVGPKQQDDTFGDLADNFDSQLELPPAKRRKTGRDAREIMDSLKFTLPSLHDPEHATAKIAKKPVLDLNDTQLLIDHETINALYNNSGKAGLRNDGRGAFTKKINRRYNISNDEAYDLLKENHQNKVRSTLGNMAVEHSMPAIKLQWPFYSTRMHKHQARSFHRPQIEFLQNENVAFDKTKFVKKKHLKGRDIYSVYSSAKDLSLGDNSSMLLLEYSEEHPIMISNFGMGSRLINYYRRKNMDDGSRPKLEIGETSVLLPQDKSPFSIFGHIDPGEMTSAIYNTLYRAPVFRHEAKPTDFLVVRNRSGEEGHTYHLRNIENLHTVGQEFPSVDVPGPHSRKVTTASKNRLKMVSFRLLRHSKTGQIPVGDVTTHFSDTSDLQNRQKMKEFLQFSKENKKWTMRPGEAIPDEESIRAMVKPEDVCLLESMEVGQRHLQDAGFSRGDDQSEDDENKEGQSVEQQLAPWYTSRNFLTAAQGKAMLQLHGEGDPSGRGEAFSFIKTSMKGGFKAMGESVEDKLDAKKLKELGGHSYNVARQQRSYEESIRRIWEAQKRSLSSAMEQSDTDMDDEHMEAAEDSFGDTRTPRSGVQTPSIFRRPDDETASQVSRMSANSQAGNILKITREFRDKYGHLSREEDIIRDPHVIHHYLKIRRAKGLETMKLDQAEPTGNAEKDQQTLQGIQQELSRLQRNKERRIARDKQKGVHTDGAADTPASPTGAGAVVTGPKPAGTQRKCASCGQTVSAAKWYDEAGGWVRRLGLRHGCSVDMNPLYVLTLCDGDLASCVIKTDD